MTTLNDEQLDRYARHIFLREIGGAGQKRLLESSVLVVGAGGLGSPLLLYLAAAGVGRIGIIDDDVVSLSNLQRQVIHRSADIGTPKVDSAARAIAALNPDVKVETHAMRLTAANALDLIGRYAIVADGCDNFATRFLVNDAAFFAKRTLVSAAVGQFDGQLSVFKAHARGADGSRMPCYRCLFPEPPPPETVQNCSEAGVLGALTGVMGTMQGLETVKEIAGFGESLAGRLLLYDGLASAMRTVRIRRDPECALCGDKPSILNVADGRAALCAAG